MPASVSPILWNALVNATAAINVHLGASTGAKSGRKMRLNHIPLPNGEYHPRDKRPRPAACSSVTTTVPSSAPCCAKRRASRLVDSVVSI